MRHFETVAELVAVGEETAAAIAAAGLEPLRYGQLRSLVARTVEQLNDLGIGKGERVAIVLKNGPEMAAAFLAVAAGATAAPLNPNYQSEQFEVFLKKLRAQALVVENGGENPSPGGAGRAGVSVFYLHPH